MVPDLEKQPRVADNRLLAKAAEALDGGPTEAQPVAGRKVDSLGAVQPCVETPMVGAGEGHHKLPRHLQCCNRAFHQRQQNTHALQACPFSLAGLHHSANLCRNRPPEDMGAEVC